LSGIATISADLQLAVHVRLVGLEERALRSDGDGLGQRAERERHVDARDAADHDRNVRPDALAEARHRDLDVVLAGKDVDDRVGAFRIGHRFACEVVVLVDDRDCCAGNGRALRVLHLSDHAAV
jgi:hypothetical protein